MLLYKLFHWIKPFFERVFDSLAPILGPIKQRLENFYNTTIGWIILAPLYLVLRFVVWAVVVFLLPAVLLRGPINLVYRTFGIAFGDKGSWVIAILTILLIYGLPILSAVLYSREQEDREKERSWYRRKLAEMQEGLRAKLRRAARTDRPDRARHPGSLRTWRKGRTHPRPRRGLLSRSLRGVQVRALHAEPLPIL